MSVLVVDDGGGDDTSCQRLRRAAGAERAELFVTVAGGDTAAPDRVPADRSPGTAAVVAVGASNATAVGAEWGVDRGRVTTVADPSDLAAIATAIGTACERWSPTPVAVCVDALTPLVTATSAQSVVELIAAVADHLGTTDAVLHYHLASGAHDPAVVDAIAAVVDEVRGREHDGDTEDPTPADRTSLDADTEDRPGASPDRSDDDVTEASDDDVARLAEADPPAPEGRGDDDEPEEASDDDVADAFEV